MKNSKEKKVKKYSIFTPKGEVKRANKNGAKAHVIKSIMKGKE